MTALGFVSDGSAYPDWRSDDRQRRLISRWIKVAELAIYESDDEGLDNALNALYDLFHAL